MSEMEELLAMTGRVNSRNDMIELENEELRKAMFDFQGKYNKLMDALVEIRDSMHRNYDDSYYLEDIDRIIEEATK